MLAVKTYAEDYIDGCRSRMEAQLAAYTDLVTAAGSSKASTRAAVEAFEPRFFNNLTLVLDASFMHRTRVLEGKDGNPLNEVGMLCSSLVSNDGVSAADKTIKYHPETSVSKLRVGDEIRLDEKQFHLLCEAFFAEIERRFT